MGSTRDVMELFAERDIHRLFSEYDGWKIARVSGPGTASIFYRVSRGKWGGEETAFIAVSFDRVPHEKSVSALDLLPDGKGSKTRKYLLTPQATDTSAIPPHIRILRMDAFAFDKAGLVWLTKKKNAKMFVPEPAVTALTTG
ncbi:MAG: hypothetical protein Q7T80_05675 [Methanoregula sp.]|nr:hypothetical protein [Methanoregula sp.]